MHRHSPPAMENSFNFHGHSRIVLGRPSPLADGHQPLPGGGAFRGVARPRPASRLYAYLNERQQWCFEAELNAVSPRLIQATLAAEDRRFYHHVAWTRWPSARASFQNLTRRRVVSGASTLSMQVVKLAGHPSRSLGGKLRQAAEAVRLEPARLQGARSCGLILTTPLMDSTWSACEAASRRYFGKSARELTLAEAALLAALPRSPSRLMPLGYPERALRGRNRVLGRMREEGLISEAERQRAVAAPLGVAWHAFPRLAPHLAQRMRSLAQDHMSARTTLDRELQTTAEGLVRNYLKQFGGEVQNAAVIVVDVRASTSVRAWVRFGRLLQLQLRQSNGCHAGPAARRARRSSRSSMPWGWSAIAFIPPRCCSTARSTWDPTTPRISISATTGLIPATNALRQSLNVPAVMMLGRVGQPAVYDFLKSAGLTTLRRPARPVWPRAGGGQLRGATR